MVPRTSAHCQSKNLSSSVAISRRPFTGGLVSRVSTSSHGLNFAERDRTFSFSVRAEASAEVDVLVEKENEEAEETEISPVDKPQKEPRVKLGDIMGVIA